MRSVWLLVCVFAFFSCRTASFISIDGRKKGNDLVVDTKVPAICPNDSNPSCKGVKCPDAANPLCKKESICPDPANALCAQVICPDAANFSCKKESICPDPANALCAQVKCPDAANYLCKKESICPDKANALCDQVKCPDAANYLCKKESICPDKANALCDQVKCPDAANYLCKEESICPDKANSLCDLVKCPDAANSLCKPVRVECPDSSNPLCDCVNQSVSQSNSQCNPERAKCPDDSNPECEIFALCKAHPERKLVANLYKLTVGTAQLPDFGTMSRIDSFCMRQLDIRDHDYKRGFPGVESLDEWFGLDITWKVNVPSSGEHRFKMNSDDGSILFIDDTLVISNDGLHVHKAVEGTAKLTAGWHEFHVKYYQGPRFRIALELFWRTPDSTTWTFIPERLFERK